MEASAKDARVKEARELARKEQQRKAEIFGAENVYRTTKARGPLVQVPKLLQQTREEEEAARKAGLDKSQPKQYQFLKESLDAMEADYAKKERAAKERKYERDRKRLQVGGKGDEAVGDEEEDDEMGDLSARLATMTDEEFKELAM